MAWEGLGGQSQWSQSLAGARSWELLLLLHLAGVAAQDLRYQVFQPVSVSALAGSCVTLPCNFTYPDNIEPVRDLQVCWLRRGFHGEFIYNHTENFTHPDYRGCITLVGDPRGSRTASICIDRLRASDSNFYLCFIRVQTNNGQWEQWRNVIGTKLTVTVAAQDPRYQVSQPVSVSAPAGSCITLPCTFTYPKDIEPVQDLRVYWRRGSFHGEFIYSHTENVTHLDYRGRITLVGDPRGNRTASICIDRLRASDASVYVCQLRVQKRDSHWEHWEHVAGTNLTVTGPAALGTAHLILLSLGSAAVKAGVCLAMFALGRRLSWDHGPGITL